MERFLRKWIRCWARSCSFLGLPEAWPAQVTGTRVTARASADTRAGRPGRKECGGHDLDTRVEADGGCRIGGYGRKAACQGLDHQVSSRDHVLGLGQCVGTAVQEHRGQHRPRTGSEDGHVGCRLSLA